MSKFTFLAFALLFGLAGGKTDTTPVAVTPAGQVFTRLINPEGHTSTAYRHFIDKGLADQTGSCWFMGSEGVCRYAEGHFTLYRSIDGLYMGYGGAIAEDRAGNVWFGVLGGVVRYDLEASQKTQKIICSAYRIKEYSGLNPLREIREAPGSPNMVRLLMQDRKGRIWFATGHQLYRTEGASAVATTGIGAYLKGLRLQYACTNPDDYDICGLYQDEDGNLLISVNACSCGPPATYLLKADRLDHPCIIGQCSHDLLQSDQYLAHSHEVAASVRQVTTMDGNARIAFSSTMQDRSGKIWIGSDSGVYTYERGYFVARKLNDTLDRSRISAICQDASGAIWFGTGEGLHFRGNGVFRYQVFAADSSSGISHFTTATGLPAQTPFKNDIITSLLPDDNGRIWIAGDGGICYSSGGSFVDPSTGSIKNKLPVYFVMKDKTGSIWFSTWELGLYRYWSGRIESLSQP